MDRHPAMEFFFHTHSDLNEAVPKIEVALRRMETEDTVTPVAVEELLGTVDRLRDEAEDHFRSEENTLFPVLIKALPELEGPVTGLLAEHDDMRYCINGLRKALGRIVTDRTAIHEALTYATNYTRCLADHSSLEDRTLYRYASEHLGEEQLNEMGAQLEEVQTRNAPR
jgi:hemerythrin-like domain-containing protein